MEAQTNQKVVNTKRKPTAKHLNHLARLSLFKQHFGPSDDDVTTSIGTLKLLRSISEYGGGGDSSCCMMDFYLQEDFTTWSPYRD